MPFYTDWKPTREENPDYRCKCGSNDIWYRKWESSDGAYDDIQYKCYTCGRIWWYEGLDA